MATSNYNPADVKKLLDEIQILQRKLQSRSLKTATDTDSSLKRTVTGIIEAAKKVNGGPLG